MKRTELFFERPDALQATQPPEARGSSRDDVRLLVSTASGHAHSTFERLADFLAPGDLLVVNDSATLAASLPVHSERTGAVRLNAATHYGDNIWLAEPRWSSGRPGPLPLSTGDKLSIDGAQVRLLAPFPGLPRLWYVQASTSLRPLMARVGEPIRYGYLAESQPLDAYQTIFARVPGSAEMPSAARPFTPRVVASLAERGVRVAAITLHAGVSSQEVEADEMAEHPIPAEPFSVSAEVAEAVQGARLSGGRVIAVGTTVVRALETAWNGEQQRRGSVRAVRGFTRLAIHPERGVRVVDGLLTGLHDPFASHLAMLHAIGGAERVRAAYTEAVRAGYLWHEFGDSHLILPNAG